MLENAGKTEMIEQLRGVQEKKISFIPVFINFLVTNTKKLLGFTGDSHLLWLFSLFEFF